MLIARRRTWRQDNGARRRDTGSRRQGRGMFGRKQTTAALPQRKPESRCSMGVALCDDEPNVEKPTHGHRHRREYDTPPSENSGVAGKGNKFCAASREIKKLAGWRPRFFIESTVSSSRFGVENPSRPKGEPNAGCRPKSRRRGKLKKLAPPKTQQAAVGDKAEETQQAVTFRCG